MARADSKTVRFTRVVERSGQPHVHTLWVDPEKDSELKRARDANRVMVVQGGGTSGKTDVGVVGFEPERDRRAQLLIFPKSLKPFEGARVIGVKFDLLEQPEIVAASGGKKDRAAARQAQAAAAKRARQASETLKPESEEAEADHPPEPKAPPKRAASTSAPKRVDKAKAAPKAEAPEHTEDAASPPERAAALGPLVREVRAAMKELQSGKAVAAYQRLERAIAKV